MIERLDGSNPCGELPATAQIDREQRLFKTALSNAYLLVESIVRSNPGIATDSTIRGALRWAGFDPYIVSSACFGLEQRFDYSGPYDGLALRRQPSQI